MFRKIGITVLVLVVTVVISIIYPVYAEEAFTYVIYALVPILLQMVIQKIHEKDNISKVILSAISLLILLYNVFILGSVVKDIYPLQLTEPFYYAFYVILPAILPAILTKNFTQRSKNKED